MFTPTDCQHIPHCHVVPDGDGDCGELGIPRDGVRLHHRGGQVLVQKGGIWLTVQATRHGELDLNVGGQGENRFQADSGENGVADGMNALTEFPDIGTAHENVDDADIAGVRTLETDPVLGFCGIAKEDFKEVSLHSIEPGAYRDGHCAIRVAFKIVKAETTVERFYNRWCR
ncbi:hypothetical protein D3C77_331950 [compost metagenome]